jgi:hypothetical protein
MNAGTAERAVLMTAEAGGPALDAAEFEALYEWLRQVPGWGRRTGAAR